MRKRKNNEFMKDLARLVQSFSDNLEEYRKNGLSLDEIHEYCELDFAIHRTIMLQKYENYLTYEEFLEILYELMLQDPDKYTKNPEQYKNDLQGLKK